jgi:hypothetical protein
MAGYSVNLWGCRPSLAEANGYRDGFDCCHSGQDFDTYEAAEAAYHRDVETYYVVWIELTDPEGKRLAERPNGLYDAERDCQESEREDQEYAALCASEARILYPYGNS